MSRIATLIERRPWLKFGLPAGLLLAAVTSVVVPVSTGKVPFAFQDATAFALGDEQNIAARIYLDRPSYHRGDIVAYRFELLWRDALVRPDIEAFQQAISFYPFDRRSDTASESQVAGGIRQFSADFALQPVDVVTSRSYQLDTVTVFYTEAVDGHSEVRALRSNPPPIYLGSFYPADVSAIPTRSTKPRLNDASTLRAGLLAMFGLLLLVLCAALLWERCRRRPEAELSSAERLWHDVEALRRSGLRNRAYLIELEQRFVAALDLRAGLGATDLWSGRQNAPGEWRELLAEACAVYAAAYQADEPEAETFGLGEELIDRLLEPLVEAGRLRREREERPIERLRQLPRVQAAAIGLVLAAVLSLTFAVAPSSWLAEDITAYNAAVKLLEESADPQAALDAFLVLADRADEPRVRAASLYNSGTLLGDFRLMRLSRSQYENFLHAVFLPEVTLGRLLHDMELDAEFELVTLLNDITRRYVQAEAALKAAVRADPLNADARRNLEIFAKIRGAIARSLDSLVRQGEEGDGSEQMLSQTVIDLKMLMDSELPEEFAREDEGKDDRDYYIMERF